MRYPILASALTLLLGSGLAFAANDEEIQETDTTTYQNQNAQGQDQTIKDTDTATLKETPKGDTLSIKESETITDSAGKVQNVNVFFETAKYDLQGSAEANLKSLAEWVKCDPSHSILLEGFADPRGTQAFNMKLSAQRAATVRQNLIQQGVPSRRIVVSVFGENGPRKATMAEERRVTARAEQNPMTPSDLAG